MNLVLYSNQVELYFNKSNLMNIVINLTVHNHSIINLYTTPSEPTIEPPPVKSATEPTTRKPTKSKPMLERPEANPVGFIRSVTFDQDCESIFNIIAGASRYNDKNCKKYLDNDQMPHSKLLTIVGGKISTEHLEDALWHLKDTKKIEMSLSGMSKKLYRAMENIKESN